MLSPVFFEKIDFHGGYKIALATLNVEKSLNSLSLEMIDLLYGKLIEWQKDETIALVFLQAAGDKAFCAGGDIRKLYDSMLACGSQKQNVYAEQFFEREYRLDYLIHTYPKPIICWGHGIVMGGGVGLAAGCSHRVVTQASRIAMPEISIGLFPDVGGTWILNQMPGGVGLFLGLTGANVNAADALFVGMADHFITHDRKAAVLEALLSSPWSEQSEDNHKLIGSILRHFELESQDSLPHSKVQEHFDLIDRLTQAKDVLSVVERICKLESSDPWLDRARNTLQAGSPVTMNLIFEQLKRGRQLSLEEIFQMEWGMAVHCTKNHDFPEGVRALLIDKDGKPDWRYKAPDAVPSELINSFFKPLDGPSPLQDLGAFL